MDNNIDQEKNQEKQKLSYENYVYQQQLKMLKGEMEKITLTMLDLANAKRTVESISVADALVPIGGNAFIETTVSSDRIFVPIGGGYMLKMNREGAEEEIERRLESTKKVVEKLQVEYENMSKKLTEIQEKMRVPQ